MPVAVITDTTSSLPPQVAAQWGVSVVSLQVTLNGRIDDESRFEREALVRALRAGQSISTAPPDSGAFFWTYQDAVSSGADAIVSLHISGRMSATVAAAQEAAQQVSVPVHIIDTATTSMSLGFAVLSAARAAAAGAQADRVIEAASRRCQNSAEIFYVDTLDYLRRGGRIGAATALIGGALSIKPLLTVINGQVAPLARVPGSKRALSRMLDSAVQHAGQNSVDIAVSNTTPTGQEMQMIQQLRNRIPGLNDIMLVTVSAVLATHLGPDALGITIAPTL